MTLAELPRTELLARLRSQVAVKEGRIRQTPFPVHPELAALLPDGGLKPGSAYSISGAGALLLALLAEPSREGYWCGVVGMPDFGAEAAAHAGVDLDRLALVPDPAEQWMATTAALVEALPIVAVHPSGRVTEGEAARLMSRLRDREAVLLVDGPWPRAEAQLAVSGLSWSGVGAGFGYLTSREVTVTVSSRRSPLRRSVRLVLPTKEGRLTAVAAAAEAPAILRAVG
ncbi:MAG TPA: hypothetical protein VGK53_13305 [Propionicimonas sp.]